MGNGRVDTRAGALGKPFLHPPSQSVRTFLEVFVCCNYLERSNTILTDVRLDDVGLRSPGHVGEVEPRLVHGRAGVGVPLRVQGRRAVDDAVRALAPQIP